MGNGQVECVHADGAVIGSDALEVDEGWERALDDDSHTDRIGIA